MSGKRADFRVSYPEYDAAGSAFMAACIKELMEAQGGVYSLVSKESVEHLPTYSAELESGETLDSKPVEVGFNISIKNDDIIEGRYDDFIAELNRAAIEQEAEVSKKILADISNVTQATGNVIQGDISYDLLIDAVDAMEFSFDDDGNHNLSLVVNPVTAEKLRSLGEPTPQQTARLNAVLARKKAEWDARRGSRSLPSKRHRA
ncbi:hypothetical protein O7605_30020 [Verrucosispora sp. WMMA2121]|uniref:hypothetical protein n=1 Tax=Verrucosispora sp. WMMA2121 TaxID=3015164 RepID=UPI0022B6F6A2|nr:hypothetical protein [Verrucosispora sp. WMMA2121]MCZ7423753.1 hypothetical protein [Verrucosispora sp. WMMA2121]